MHVRPVTFNIYQLFHTQKQFSFRLEPSYVQLIWERKWRAITSNKDLYHTIYDIHDKTSIHDINVLCLFLEYIYIRIKPKVF